MQTDQQHVADFTVVKAIWKWINRWPDMPAAVGEIGLDALEKASPSISMQPLSGTVIDTQFINGSFIGRWPFAIIVKADVGTNEDRIDSFTALERLYAWMSTEPLPELPNHNTAYKIEMTALPFKSAVDDSGNEYYEAPFALTYHHKEGD